MLLMNGIISDSTSHNNEDKAIFSEFIRTLKIACSICKEANFFIKLMIRTLLSALKGNIWITMNQN